MSTPPRAFHNRGGVQEEQAKLIARGRELAYAKPRGRFLGRLNCWGLDVYENSPAPWRDALLAEWRVRNG